MAGVLALFGAAIFAGSPLPDLIARFAGKGAVTAGSVGLAALGLLFMLAAVAYWGDYVSVDEIAIEQCRMGRPRLRMLWEDVDRLTLHRPRGRGLGPVELRARGRSMAIHPTLKGFEDLLEFARAQAEQIGAEVRDWRDGDSASGAPVPRVPVSRNGNGGNGG